MNGNGFYALNGDPAVISKKDLAPFHNLSLFVQLDVNSSAGRNDEYCKIDTNYVFSIYGFKIDG